MGLSRVVLCERAVTMDPLYPLCTTDNTIIGPIWSRVHAMGEGGRDATCRRIEQVKKALGVTVVGLSALMLRNAFLFFSRSMCFLFCQKVKRLISGHTPQYDTGTILSLCGGSYMVIDVGISDYYGNVRCL